MGTFSSEMSSSRSREARAEVVVGSSSEVGIARAGTMGSV